MSKIDEAWIAKRDLWHIVGMAVLAVIILALASGAEVGALPDPDLPAETPSAPAGPVHSADDTLVYLPFIAKSGESGEDPTPTPTRAACYPVAVGAPVTVGANPYGSASDERDEVFVANHGSNSVTVLRGAEVHATITDPRLSQPYGVAYNPVNDAIYVTNEGNGILLLIDPDTHAVIKEMGGLANPRGIGIDRVTGTAYVASPGATADGEMRVYTLADVTHPLFTEGTLINDIGNWPSMVAVDSETHKVYVTLNGNTQLAVIKPTINGATIDYPFDIVNLNTAGPFGVAHNDQNDRLYVASGVGSTLSVLDLSGDEVAFAAALKTNPEYNLDTVSVNPKSGRAFVAGRRVDGSVLWALDVISNTWKSSYNIGANPSGEWQRGNTYDPVRDWIYVSNDYEGKVYVFDDSWGPTCPDTGPWTPTPTPEPCCPKPVNGAAAVGPKPYGSAAAANGRVFVANNGDEGALLYPLVDGETGSISVIQGTGVIHTITDVVRPYGVAYNPIDGYIYVTDQATGELVLIDPTSLSIAHRVHGGAQPRGLAVDESTGKVYVASPGDGKVHVVDPFATNQWTEVDVGSNTGPTWVAVNSTTHRAYVSLNNGDKVAVVRDNGGSYQAAHIGSGLTHAFGIAVNETLNRLYVASTDGAQLHVFDIGKPFGEETPLPVELKTDPEYILDGVAVNPASGRVFVTGRRNLTSKMWVLNGHTNTWLETSYTVGSYEPGTGMMRGVSFNRWNNRVYVSCEYLNRVYLFDDSGSPACP